MSSTHLNFLRLITNDVDNIRQGDSDNLGGNLDHRAVGASFGCPPSCSSWDRGSRRKDPDAYTLEKKELFFRKTKTIRLLKTVLSVKKHLNIIEKKIVKIY
jgi:hypothetical protein